MRIWVVFVISSFAGLLSGKYGWGGCKRYAGVVLEVGWGTRKGMIFWVELFVFK